MLSRWLVRLRIRSFGRLINRARSPPRRPITVAVGSFPITNWGSWIWDSFIPPTRSTLLWTLIWGKVPTLDVLASWGISGPSICVFYRNDSETRDHIFSCCPYVAALIKDVAALFGFSIDVAFGFHC